MKDKRSPSGKQIGTTGTVTLTYPLIAAAGSDTQTGACPGALVGDLVLVNPAAALAAGLVISQARVSAANTIAVELGNITAGGLTPGATVFGYELRHV
jgi:hypothetical protein